MCTKTATTDTVTTHWSKPWTEYLGLAPASSFLPVAVIFGLIGYVKAAVRLKYSRHSQTDPNIPLLHYTIPCTWRSGTSLHKILKLRTHGTFLDTILNLRMIEVLLEAKENPNHPCPEISPYQQAINFADHFYQSREERLTAFEVLAMMLKFGANPQVSGEAGQHIYASTILDDFHFKEGSSSKDIQDLDTEVIALSKAIETAFESNRLHLKKLFREEKKKPLSKRLSIIQWVKKIKA